MLGLGESLRTGGKESPGVITELGRPLAGGLLGKLDLNLSHITGLHPDLHIP
jgi:hypothetical protein